MVTMQNDYERMEYTGERMVPEGADYMTFWEHVHRYQFAARFVDNKRVLDIACGEGYGTAALAKAGAVRVIGMDISEEACEHARRKYGVDCFAGNAENIPLADESIDLIVSFETIEHLEGPMAFLDECVRVLAPGGTLIISTPNKEVNSEAGHYNQFHNFEVSEEEFKAMLNPRFSSLALYTQRSMMAPWWSIRSFAAYSKPWDRIRGAGRLRNMIVEASCPHIVGEVNSAYRMKVVDKVLENPPSMAKLVNPFIVRKRLIWGEEQACYYIAIAHL